MWVCEKNMCVCVCVCVCVCEAASGEGGAAAVWARARRACLFARVRRLSAVCGGVFVLTYFFCAFVSSAFPAAP
jgi:hypothetical protein